MILIIIREQYRLRVNHISFQYRYSKKQSLDVKCLDILCIADVMRRAPGPTHGKTPGSGQGCSSINHSIELCCCAFGCSNRLRMGYKVIKFPADQGLWKSVKEKLQRLTQTFTSGSLEVQPKMMMRETISHMAILFIVTCPARLSVECHGL